MRASFSRRGLLAVWLGLAVTSQLPATEPRVAGLDDLVIFHPNDHERGLPKVEFKQTEEGLKVDIAPTVHVHRYYYSGDREYQGPILQGGPTVIVANHPKSNERLYINVMLPSGTPVIAYDKDSITYIYPNYRVKVCFLPFFKNKFTVKYLQGEGIARKVHEAGAHVSSEVKECVHNSKLANNLGTAARGTGQVMVSTVGVAASAANAGIQTVGKVVSVVPGVRPLQSAAENRPDEQYLDSISRAEARNTRNQTPFVTTNR